MPVETSGKFIRIRLQDPGKFQTCRTVKLKGVPRGTKMIACCMSRIPEGGRCRHGLIGQSILVPKRLGMRKAKKIARKFKR